MQEKRIGRFYNAGAWGDEKGLVVLARQAGGAAESGKPDATPLVMMTGQDRWIPWIPGDQGIASLEDARMMMRDDGHLVAVGLTAVFKGGSGFEEYPAMVHGPREKWRKMPDVRVIEEFGCGKNATPMGDGRVMFRPEGWNHSWLVANCNGGKPQKVAEIDLSREVPEWGKFKMGTGTPPTWLSQDEALMVVHGMTYDPREDFYRYSLGRARLRVLDNGHYEVKVHPRPILTAGQFGKHQQLHPELREAIYVTGAYLQGENLNLLVNVGDCQTVEVAMRMADLVRWS